VDFATAASQNGFSTCKLSLHKKTNIIKKMTKKFDFSLPSSFIIEHSCKKDHYMTHLLSNANTVL
jgi:hypothetical protein